MSNWTPVIVYMQDTTCMQDRNEMMEGKPHLRHKKQRVHDILWHLFTDHMNNGSVNHQQGTYQLTKKVMKCGSCACGIAYQVVIYN